MALNINLPNGFEYQSSHKFRHGHIQYGLRQSKSIADHKAISLNVLHSSMEITDQFYSNLNDGEVENRIGSLGKETKSQAQDYLTLIQEFLEKEEQQKPNKI